MGDENTVLTPAEARHLLRRTGFGAPADEVQRLLTKYGTRGRAADFLLGFKLASFRPGGRDLDDRQKSWLVYMLKTKSPLQEKLVLFWHDHFATNNTTVGNSKRMANQNGLLRQHCKGNFKTFVNAINLDAAMMVFLDTVRNQKFQPNENYPRELLELFTLGVLDSNGSPNYAQEDIVQIARAFSGWRVDDRDQPFLNEGQHDYSEDYPERGPKVIFQTYGGFGSAGRSFAGAGEGEPEIAAVIDVLFDHRDSDGKKTIARRVARRLLEYFAHGAFSVPSPATTAVVDDVVAESGFDQTWELRPLLRAIFTSDAFFETSSPAPDGPSTIRSVKWPVDYAVTAMRTLGIKPSGKDGRIDGGSRRRLIEHLVNMGQEVFEPPSVFGWDWENSWLTSRTFLARATFARDLTVARGNGGTHFRPERLVDLTLTDPAAIVDEVAGLLGVADRIGPEEHDVFVDYLTNEGTRSSLDLQDEEIRESKLAGLFALILQSPAFQLH